MKLIPFLIFFYCIFESYAQESLNLEIYNRLIDLHDVHDSSNSSYPELKEILKDARIVMLGEQSHLDGTTTKTKVKLIEFLHRDMGFEILAFESGMFDCDKAWQEIEQGARADSLLAMSVFGLWSESMEFLPLSNYIAENARTAHPLIVKGFDNQFTGRLSSEYFAQALKAYLKSIDSSLLSTQQWMHLESTLSLMTGHDYKTLRNYDYSTDSIFIDTLISNIKSKPSNKSSFWIQSLRNVQISMNGSSFERDKQMAENLIWIAERNPNKKIICWGATSHFLYNSQLIEMADDKMAKYLGDYYKDNPSMGNYLKAKYGDKLSAIGFVACSGSYGMGKPTEIPEAKINSLEYVIGMSDFENCFLPLKGLDLSPLQSRPLSHQYMTTDIAKVMDGVIFNRKMAKPAANLDLIYELHPEYKWSKKRAKREAREARKKKP